MSNGRPPADDPLGTLLFEMTVVDDSKSPLQLIGADLLAHYRRCEAKHSGREIPCSFHPRLGISFRKYFRG